MRLPWIYTPLEYIEGDGTCSIYTGFVPKTNDLRLRVDFAYTNTRGSYAIAGGARSIRSGGGYVGSIACYFLSYSASYGNMSVRVGEKVYSNAFQVNVNTRYVLDVEALDGGATASLGGKTVTLEGVGNLNHTYGVYLFCDATNTGTRAPAKMWSAQIWADGELVRDMVPVRRNDGLVGMYDLVTETMMSNQGTGTFTAGPQAISLPQLVTDRTEEDAAYTEALYQRLADPDLPEAERGALLQELLTSETVDKGTYNAEDLNRVETATMMLREDISRLPAVLEDRANALELDWDPLYDPDLTPPTLTGKTDWTVQGLPGTSDMARYLGNVRTLGETLNVQNPALPASMDDLTVQGANAIEEALEADYEALEDRLAEKTAIIQAAADTVLRSGKAWAAMR